MKNINSNNNADLASPIKRLYAFILDVGIIVMIIFMVAPISKGFMFISNSTFLDLIFILSYFVIPTAIKGKTLGKWITGIKVVDLEGYLPGPKAIPREIAGRFVSLIVIGIGVLWIIFDKKNQSWHDKIAGTIVIEDSNFSLFNKLFSRSKPDKKSK